MIGGDFCGWKHLNIIASAIIFFNMLPLHHENFKS